MPMEPIYHNGVQIGERMTSAPSIAQYNSFTYAEFIEQLTETELDNVFALKRGAQGAKVERFLEVIKARNSVDFNVARTLINMQSLVPAVFVDQARVAEITGAAQ